ncbi:MAG: outer membrane beta-barrel protein [Planctomycetia bacterium]|nr:outer membrane beta-barrel protein [Planctomycetia bacterium]
MKRNLFWKNALVLGWSVLLFTTGDLWGVSAEQYIPTYYPTVSSANGYPVASPTVTPAAYGYAPATPPTALPQRMVPEVAPPVVAVDRPVVYSECEGTLDGLVLPRLNTSPAMQAGSFLLGPGSFFIDGYLDQGLTFSNAHSDYYNPVAPNDKEGYELNQLYLAMGRRVDQTGGWAIGGRVDFMYGTDYYYVSSLGLENHPDNGNHWNGMSDSRDYRIGRNQYGLAMPQAYVEIYSPILRGIDIKVGHFYSVMGFESPMAPMNFFYSRSYASIYGMPQTMTGVMTTSRLNDRWNVILGAVNEWNAWNSLEDNFSFVGGLTFNSLNNRFSLAATVMTGDQIAPAFQPVTFAEAANTTLLNLYARASLTRRLTYVVEFTAGWDDRDYFCMETLDNKHGRSWYGVTNNLFFQVNSCLTLGTRFEWFRDCDNTIIDGGYGVASNQEGADYFALTFGANWQPLSWLTIRPELRWDFSNFEISGAPQWKTYDNMTSDSILTFAADAIIRF